MADRKKASDPSRELAQLEEGWKPDRPMGLARAIAKAGHATRTRAEEIVRSGRIKVDGRVITDPRLCVGPDTEIFLDEKPLLAVIHRYFALHKPPRVLSTTAERMGQRCVHDLFPSDVPGLAPAGRLDPGTTGLLLVSNDSAWNEIAAVAAGLSKEYRVVVKGALTAVEIGVIESGMHLPTLGFVKPESLKIIASRPNRTVLALRVGGGKNRQIRRIFGSLRHDVLELCRTKIGPVALGNLPVGRLRPLTRQEVTQIRESAGSAG